MPDAAVHKCKKFAHRGRTVRENCLVREFFFPPLISAIYTCARIHDLSDLFKENFLSPWVEIEFSRLDHRRDAVAARVQRRTVNRHSRSDLSDRECLRGRIDFLRADLIAGILTLCHLGAVSPLRRGVDRGCEQLLEGGRSQHPESPVPAGRANVLLHHILPAQAATAGAPRPRRRRLTQHRLRLRAAALLPLRSTTLTAAPTLQRRFCLFYLRIALASRSAARHAIPHVTLRSRGCTNERGSRWLSLRCLENGNYFERKRRIRRATESVAGTPSCTLRVLLPGKL